MLKPDRQKLFDKAIRLVNQGVVKQASIARQLGIDPSTLTKWLNKGARDDDPHYRDFYFAFHKAIGEREKQLMSALDYLVMEHDFNAIKFTATHVFGWGVDAAVEERILKEILGYIATKVDKESFDAIIEGIKAGELHG